MFGAEAGLTNPTVLAMTQDRRGYLWVATEGGVFRYDGDRFEPIPVVGGGQPGGMYSLERSADGSVWAGSSSGLYRVLGRRLALVRGMAGRPVGSGSSIAFGGGRVYFASRQGLFSGPVDGTADAVQIATEPARSVFVDRDGAVWWGCGVNLCYRRDGKTIALGAAEGLEAGPWRAIAQDLDGRMWIRSAVAVLMREKGSARFRHIPGLPRLDSAAALRIVPTRHGEVVIPHSNGVAICKELHCTLFGPKNGLRRAEVNAALEDREGSLWLGYAGHGLARWLGREDWAGFGEEEGLASPGIWRIVRDAEGALWVGANRGLYRARQVDGGLRFERSPVVGEHSIYGLAADPGGGLAIGTFQDEVGGLTLYDPATGRKTVLRPPDAPRPFEVHDVYADHDGALWIATSRGLYVRRKGKPMEKFAPVGDALIRCVASVPTGLYVATDRGVYVQRGKLRRFLTTADGLPDANAQEIALSPSGDVWVTFLSASGITRLRFPDGRPQAETITTAQGLISNVAYSQFFDRYGRHWVTTDIGAAVEQAGQWSVVDVSDGLIWNDCNAGALLEEPDGTIWIGTSSGLSRFRPAPPLDRPKPEVLITSLLRNDAASEPGDFDSSTYSVALRFSLLSFRRDHKVFRYRLGGPSSPWIVTRNNEVRFAELPPGRFTFEVQGETAPDSWSDSASVSFRIHPAWYSAWQFRLAALLALGGCIWWWWRARERRQHLVRASLAVAVEERTRELAEAKARAELASRYKGEFVANMSHEVRTPLNGVIGLTELALELNRDPEVARHLEIAHTSAKGLLMLINDVLDFSKVESGRLEIAPSPFEPRGLLDGLRSMFAPQAAAKGLRLEIGVRDSVPEWLFADDARLRQVLINLVGNALKFTSTGSVTVHADYVGGELCIVVADTGIGIPEDQLAGIFDAFRQADNSTSRRFGGTGLGLTISKRLMLLMRGQLGVTSEVGRGSTFTARFPAPECAAPETPTPPVEPSGKAPRLEILVAEDNRVNQYLMRALLTRMGHSVTIAENGLEALARIAEHRFDAVLMDIQMPELDGVETVERIRRAELGTSERLPVIALTARAMVGDREALLAAGMDDYLEKPVHAPRLEAALLAVAARVQDQAGQR